MRMGINIDIRKWRFEIRAVLLLSLVLSVSIYSGRAQNRKDTTNIDKVQVLFRLGGSIIDSTYLNNKSALELMDYLLRDTLRTYTLDSITLKGTASPDGGERYNMKLSERRANNMMEYITKNYPNVANRLKVTFTGEDWAGLREIVMADDIVPFKEEVLAVIDSNASLATKEWRLRNMRSGLSWEYISRMILPYLRSGAWTVLHYNISHTNTPVGNMRLTLANVPNPEIPSIFTEEYSKKPILAIKTNLLYNLITAVNLEVEVPLGDRYSIAGEYIFPWWVWDDGTVDSRRDRFQITVGTIEFRRWLGERRLKSPLTGWFMGLYASYGAFDFEDDKKGKQSKDVLAGGLSIGYAHAINRSGSLRMEYLLGLGYLTFSYKEYTAVFDGTQWGWDAYRDFTKRVSWFGPTRAKVSLVLMINRKQGGRR